MDPVKHDEHDAEGLGRVDLIKDRPDAVMPVARGSEKYNMNHKNRGKALIIAYNEFRAGGPLERKCAPHDIKVCKTTFENLNYDVSVHENLTRKDLLDCLNKVSQADHSDNDSLVLIFMSHGGVNKETNIEYLEAFDGRISTFALWRNFTPEKCPSLAGKPKMFFIQACRGEDCDVGVQLSKLSVQTDSVDGSAVVEEQDYAIPLYADLLMMWASYPGMTAFKCQRGGIRGSVFIHFLTKILAENAGKEDLLSMLVYTTREVATQYESLYLKDLKYDRNKQIPQIVSTLMRKVYFQKVAIEN